MSILVIQYMSVILTPTLPQRWHPPGRKLSIGLAANVL